MPLSWWGWVPERGIGLMSSLGGEQQRASIARALVAKPEVMFADEPTGELDTTTAHSIAAILRDITMKQGTTVLVATHDPIMAGICDRTMELVDGALASPPPPAKERSTGV